MILGDMPDLVGEDAGQLRLIIKVGEQAAVDVDKSAGHRKGIDIGRVEQGEGKGRAGDIGFLQ